MTQVHLVRRVDLGSHVESAWARRNDAIEEADRLEAEYVARYGKLTVEPHYFVETIEVKELPS